MIVNSSEVADFDNNKKKKKITFCLQVPSGLSGYHFLLLLLLIVTMAAFWFNLWESQLLIHEVAKKICLLNRIFL